MEIASADRRLSQITTHWGMLLQSQRAPGADEDRSEAQRRLLDRYGPAIYRYLRGALGDPDAANELYQEFALRFVEGDLRGADPDRGRFRDYLKRTLSNLVCDHHRSRGRRPAALAAGDSGPAVEQVTEIDAEEGFLTGWRETLLARAWEDLADVERRTGRPLYAVLRVRVERPEASAAELAAQLAARLGHAPKAAWVHKWLHLARATFADLLLEGIAASLADPSSEDLEEELIDLGLVSYCRAAFDRRRGTLPGRRPSSSEE